MRNLRTNVELVLDKWFLGLLLLILTLIILLLRDDEDN